jgi:hypothetical protein
MLVILDSGCTCAITFNKRDFAGPIHPVQDVEHMDISSGLKVTGVGHILWTFLNEHSHHVQIPLTCLYIPDATTRLLPPQKLSEQKVARTTNGFWVGLGGSALVFHEGSCINFQTTMCLGFHQYHGCTFHDRESTYRQFVSGISKITADSPSTGT